MNSRYLGIGILALIAVVAAVVFAAMRNRQPETADNTAAPGGSTARYYEVPELDLRFQLPEGLDGLTYSVRNFNGSEGEAQVAYFSSGAVVERARQLGDPQGMQSCTAENGPLGAIARTSRFPSDDSRPLPQDARRLGGRYVYYTGPQATCTQNTEVQNLVSSQLNMLMAVLPETVQTRSGEAGEQVRQGSLEGSLSYPSEGIPAGIQVCAEEAGGQQIYCTQSQYENQKYDYGRGYRLFVPAGRYRVYATVAQNPRDPNATKAYYSRAVECGLTVQCTDGTPIEVEVRDGQNVENIDPQDWYNRR